MFKKVFLPLNALQFCNLTLAVKLKIDTFSFPSRSLGTCYKSEFYFILDSNLC